MAEAGFRFAIVAEDEGHFSFVTAVVDAMARSAADWLDGEVGGTPILDAVRTWLADPDTQQRYLKPRSDDPDQVVHVDGIRIALRGHVGGRPLAPEARMWRRMLAQLVTQHPRPDAILLIRDLDGTPERRAGMEQVRSRENIPWPAGMPILIATPQPEIEAWYVAGFAPETDDERRRLREIAVALSFDPTTQSHRLTSHPNEARRDAKRVLASLTGGSVERRERCAEDLALLRARGGENGCRAFLDEVESDLIPILTGASTRS